MERETLDVDILVVGAGPAGLSAALRLSQLQAQQGGEPLSVAVIDKAREAGAHSLSGALLDPTGATTIHRAAPMAATSWATAGNTRRRPGSNAVRTSIASPASRAACKSSIVAAKLPRVAHAASWALPSGPWSASNNSRRRLRRWAMAICTRSA